MPFFFIAFEMTRLSLTLCFLLFFSTITCFSLPPEVLFHRICQKKHIPDFLRNSGNGGIALLDPICNSQTSSKNMENAILKITADDIKVWTIAMIWDRIHTTYSNASPALTEGMDTSPRLSQNNKITKEESRRLKIASMLGHLNSLLEKQEYLQTFVSSLVISQKPALNTLVERFFDALNSQGYSLAPFRNAIGHDVEELEESWNAFRTTEQDEGIRHYMTRQMTFWMTEHSKMIKQLQSMLLTSIRVIGVLIREKTHPVITEKYLLESFKLMGELVSGLGKGAKVMFADSVFEWNLVDRNVDSGEPVLKDLSDVQFISQVLSFHIKPLQHKWESGDSISASTEEKFVSLYLRSWQYFGEYARAFQNLKFDGIVAESAPTDGGNFNSKISAGLNPDEHFSTQFNSMDFVGKAAFLGNNFLSMPKRHNPKQILLQLKKESKTNRPSKHFKPNGSLWKYIFMANLYIRSIEEAFYLSDTVLDLFDMGKSVKTSFPSDIFKRAEKDPQFHQLLNKFEKFSESAQVIVLDMFSVLRNLFKDVLSSRKVRVSFNAIETDYRRLELGIKVINALFDVTLLDFDSIRNAMDSHSLSLFESPMQEIYQRLKAQETLLVSEKRTFPPNLEMLKDLLYPLFGLVGICFNFYYQR